MKATRSTKPSLLPAGGRPAGDWPAPRLVPRSYPGAAPDHHHLLLGDRVLPLQAGGDSAGGLRLALPDGSPVDEVLARVGAAPLGERVPMLAYGANRSPHTLVVKFDHHGRGGGRTGGTGPTGGSGRDGAAPGPAAVPVLRGTLGGVDAVAAGLSSQGFIYADVVPSPGTRIVAYVTLLDPGQAAAIHESEGVGRGIYDCAWMPGFAVEGCAVELDVVGYAGCLPVFLSPATGTPLAFSAVEARERRFPALDQSELFGAVLESTGILDPVAALLGPITSRKPASIAAELARMLGGQWWYRHNTGDRQTAAAVRAQQVVWDALRRHSASESTAQRLAAQGAVIDAESAYACGPELRLAAQIATP